MSAPDLTRLGQWADMPFFATDWPVVAQRLDDDPRDILPPAPQIFAALELVQPRDARVIVLGQDPYPTPGHAHGLAFSVEPDVTPLPRSLINIFKEMRDDIDVMPGNGDLHHWARQGVLLLNTALTVPANTAGGHAKIGWAPLIKQILARLDTAPRALVLWGNTAQKLGAALRNPDHLRIETSHPSPLSARHSFFGSRPFSRVNTWLGDRGLQPINWIEEPK